MRSWSYLLALFALVALASGNPLAKREDGEAAGEDGDLSTTSKWLSQ